MSDSHEPDYSRHYQKFHDDSDSHFVTMRAEFAATLAPYLPQDKNAGILEIGAGMGESGVPAPFDCQLDFESGP